MKLKHRLEDLGICPNDIQVVTLATDGYSAAKHRLMLVCMAAWVEHLEDIRPEYRMVAGGDPEATETVTGIAPMIYRLEAQLPELVKDWFLGRVTSSTILAGHSVCRFSRPFLQQLCGDTPVDASIGGFFDTQVVGRVALGGRLAEGIRNCSNLALAHAKMAALSVPGHVPKSLEMMCDAYQLPLDYPGWPMAPWQKCCRTMALVSRILDEDLPEAAQ